MDIISPSCLPVTASLSCYKFIPQWKCLTNLHLIIFVSISVFPNGSYLFIMCPKCLSISFVIGISSEEFGFISVVVNDLLFLCSTLFSTTFFSTKTQSHPFFFVQPLWWSSFLQLYVTIGKSIVLRNINLLLVWCLCSSIFCLDLSRSKSSSRCIIILFEHWSPER